MTVSIFKQYAKKVRAGNTVVSNIINQKYPLTKLFKPYPNYYFYFSKVILLWEI